MAEIASIGSPKRKRSVDDEMGRAQSPLRLRTDLSDRSQAGGTSPHSHMSNEFRSLQIHPEYSTGRLSYRGKTDFDQSKMRPEMDSPAQDITLDSGRTHPENAMDATSSPQNDAQLTVTASKPPSTPALNPVSPADAPQTISPLPSMAHTPVREIPPDMAVPSSPTPAPRLKSPPPSAVTSDLVWSESEITGHNPTDPADDGYGINGIGFRPTPAIAAARAVKRRQQVSDWKARELRDARNRRAERRGRGVPMNRTASSGGINVDLRAQEAARKVVRFAEG